MKKIFAYILFTAIFVASSFAQESAETTETAPEAAETAEAAPEAEAPAPTDDKTFCRTAWDEGNHAYIDGDYRRAIECYTSIIDRNRYSMKLYYNLADAYFKVGETGRAILYYNKALKLAPSNDDVRYNLAIAEAQTKDKIAVVPEFFLNRWMRGIRNTMSCTAWSILSLAALAAIFAFALMFLLSERTAVRKTGFYGAIVALIIFVATTSFALAERRDMLQREQAIVMSSAISVKSSPDRSATDLFVLHEGTKVRIATEIDGWYEIVIADGKKGWTESRNIEQI